MPYLQNTNYHGATVDNATAEQLKKQPAADLLRFEQHGGNTVIQAKLPEKGYFNDKEYDIRVNMNYFVRGMMRAVMDKNGDIDPEKVTELVNLCNDLNQECFFPEKESRYPELLEKLDIPPARREDFETFLHANGIPHTDPSVSAPLVMTAYGPIGHLYSEIEQRLFRIWRRATVSWGQRCRNAQRNRRLHTKTSCRAIRTWQTWTRRTKRVFFTRWTALPTPV